MGFKDWFRRGTRSEVEPDSVWLGDTARLAGLAEKAASLSAVGRVLVLAHFPEMLDAVEEALSGRLDVARADAEGDVAAWLATPEPGRVGLALVDQLPAASLDLGGRSDGRVSFLVAERHPLRQQDDRVGRAAAALPYPTTVRFFLSFDDPLLERFVDDNVKNLLTQLGVDDDEELSHPMIAAAVERVQTQLAEKSPEEVRANSAADWLDTVGPIEPS